MFNKLCLYISILAALILVACDDQNFDWEKARSNSQTVYEKNFKQIFGDIPTNQCWDFTNVAKHFLTRTTTTPTYTSNSLSFAYTDGDIDFTNNTSNESLYNQLIGNNGLFKSDQQAASSVLAAPNSGTFTIMPVTTNTNSKYKLYVKVGNQTEQLIFTKDWTDSGDAKTYTHNMPIETTCGTCGGDKTIQCDACDGNRTITKYYKAEQVIDENGYGYFNIIVGNGVYATRRWLSGTDISKKDWADSTKDIYTFITVQTNASGKSIKCLFDASTGHYLKLSNNKNGLETTDNISEASEASFDTNNHLKIGDRYIAEVTINLISGNSALWFYDSTSGATEWIWTKTSTENTDAIANVQKAIAAASQKYTYQANCTNCSATGEVVCPDCGGKGYTITSYANMPGITISGVAEGTPIQIYMDILDSDGNVTKTYSTYTGNVSFITPTTTPEKLYYSDGNESVSLTTSNVLYAGMAAEDVTIGNSYAFDDLTLVIIGESDVPTQKELKTEGSTKYYELDPQTISKRYMAEDMGFAELESEAETKSYTDIDFNDIVVDFVQESAPKYVVQKIENGIITWTDNSPVTTSSTTAIIRALGGTWDFQLAVIDNEKNEVLPIFQKSLAGNDTKNTFPLTFNDEYKIPTISNVTGEVKGEKISRLWSNIIYNTNGFASSIYDGNYNYDTWIAEIASNDKLNKWDYTTNNIRFILIDKDSNNSDDLSSNDGDVWDKGTHTIDFPEIGATPKIVAFPITKHWQRERKHVTSDWFNDEIHAYSTNDDGSINKE